jgi:hypothetical protein
MPSSQETPDIYADLPAFSEKSTGDELLPPLKPMLRDTMPGIASQNPEMMENQAPVPEEEELPIPPQFKYDREELIPTQPYTVPGIPAVPEQPPNPDYMPDVPEAQAPTIPEPPAIEPEHEIPELPEHADAGRHRVAGPFIRAYDLRQIIKDTNDLNASIRLVQDVAAINEILQADASAYERFHKSVYESLKVIE